MRIGLRVCVFLFLCELCDALLFKNTTNATRNNSLLAKVFVLTNTDRTVGQYRAIIMNNDIRRIGLESKVEFVTGVDAKKYNTEAEEMSQDTIPMTEKMKREWMKTDFGSGPIHRGSSAEETSSNGALACSLGHHRMWELARDANKGHQRMWSIVLEDDADPIHGTNSASLDQLFASLRDVDVDIVHLDDRHCQAFGGHVGKVEGTEMNLYAYGSTAYAITAVGADALLKQEFSYGANHSLNVPVRAGLINAYCPPQSPYFKHADWGGSTIRGTFALSPK